MKFVLVVTIMTISVNIFSCPTKFAYKLLDEETISYKDVNKSLDY